MRQKVLIILLIAVALIAANMASVLAARLRGYFSPSESKDVTASQSHVYRSHPGSVPAVGAIVGRVVDGSQTPVYGALIKALPQKGSIRALYREYTDRDGMFRINQLEVGKYYLSASKREAGYDDIWNRFYSAGFVKDVEVTVYEGQTVSCGDVKLGPKAGKLVGTLRDAKSKNGIVSAGPAQTRHVVLCRLENPKNCYDANPNRNGDFEILVPPIPFTIEATAPGYERKALSSLRLKSGEIKRVDIWLTPKN